MNLVMLGLALGGILIVVLFLALAKWRFRNKRGLLTDPELVTLFASAVSIDRSTIVEVLGLVASAYGVERGRLRPDDRFADELSDMDSWRLDAGAENLERALLER